MMKVLENIAKNEWVVRGDIQDIMMLMHIMNEHRTLFNNETLWKHIEAVAVH